MIVRSSNYIEKVKDNLFKIIYLLLLIVILFFILDKGQNNNPPADCKKRTEQLARESDQPN